MWGGLYAFKLSPTPAGGASIGTTRDFISSVYFFQCVPRLRGAAEAATGRNDIFDTRICPQTTRAWMG